MKNDHPTREPATTAHRQLEMTVNQFARGLRKTHRAALALAAIPAFDAALPLPVDPESGPTPGRKSAKSKDREAEVVRQQQLSALAQGAGPAWMAVQLQIAMLREVVEIAVLWRGELAHEAVSTSARGKKGVEPAEPPSTLTPEERARRLHEVLGLPEDDVVTPPPRDYGQLTFLDGTGVRRLLREPEVDADAWLDAQEQEQAAQAANAVFSVVPEPVATVEAPVEEVAAEEPAPPTSPVAKPMPWEQPGLTDQQVVILKRRWEFKQQLERNALQDRAADAERARLEAEAPPVYRPRIDIDDPNWRRDYGGLGIRHDRVFDD